MGGIDLIQCFKNFLEKKIQIKFNWALILLFVFFWNHGFYGSAFTSNVSIPFYFMITLIMVFIIYFLFQYGVKSNLSLIHI